MSYVRRDWHEFCKQCGICAGILRIFAISMQKKFFRCRQDSFDFAGRLMS